jgi:hypothetical protein
MFKIDAGLAHVSLRESALRRKRTVDGGAGEIKVREANFGVGLRLVSPDQGKIEGLSLALAGDL